MQAMGSAFFDALGLSPDTHLDARRLASHQLDQIAALLPEPDTWTVVGDGKDATLVLLVGDGLLTLSRELLRGSKRQLVVTCHPARVTEVRYRRDDLQTFWRFEFPSRPSLGVDGRMNPAGPGEAETFDRAEAFARLLAPKVGWQIP